MSYKIEDSMFYKLLVDLYRSRSLSLGSYIINAKGKLNCFYNSVL